MVSGKSIRQSPAQDPSKQSPPWTRQSIAGPRLAPHTLWSARFSYRLYCSISHIYLSYIFLWCSWGLFSLPSYTLSQIPRANLGQCRQNIQRLIVLQLILLLVKEWSMRCTPDQGSWILLWVPLTATWLQPKVPECPGDSPGHCHPWHSEFLVDTASLVSQHQVSEICHGHSCYSRAYHLSKNQCLPWTVLPSSFLSCWLPSFSHWKSFTRCVFKGCLTVPGGFLSVRFHALYSTCGKTHFLTWNLQRVTIGAPSLKGKRHWGSEWIHDLGDVSKKLESTHVQGESLPLKHQDAISLPFNCTLAFLWGLYPPSSSI